MKCRQLGLVAVLVVLSPILALAADADLWEVKLPFKAATIHYTLSGMETGTETLYIRESGKETATFRTGKTSMMGTTTNTDTVEIETPDWVYSYDLVAHTGKKSVNPRKYMMEEYQRLSPAEKKLVEENAKKMGAPLSEAFGGKVEQKVGKMFGFETDRVQMMGTVVESIHGTGIPLRVESNMMGMNMKQEATSVDVGSVSQKYFDPPQGIVAVVDPESEAMARTMAQQTIAALKSPEGANSAAVMPMMPQDDNMTPEEKREMEQAMEMLKGMMGGEQK